jgi:signal transduction histidine kinase
MFRHNVRAFRVLPRHVGAVLAAVAWAVAIADLLRWVLDPAGAHASTTTLRPFIAMTTLAIAAAVALWGVGSFERIKLTLAGVGLALAAIGITITFAVGDVEPKLADLVAAGHPDHIDLNISVLLLIAGLCVFVSSRRPFGAWSAHVVVAAAGLVLGIGTMNWLAYAVESTPLLVAILPLAVRFDSAFVLVFLSAALFATAVGDVIRGPIVGRVSAAVAVAAVLIILESYLSEASSRLAIDLAGSDHALATDLLDAARAARTGILVVLFAVMVGSVVIITSTVARPIKALEGALAAFMHQHREFRAPVIQDDEIGELTLGFNKLAAENAALQHGLEVRVEERTSELAAVNQELESFAYAVSHDLRAPLRAVEGFTRSIVSDTATTLSDASRMDFDRVQAAATRMGQLIDDLLVLSRITRQDLRRERVDISLIAHEVVNDLRTHEPARAVEVTIQDGVFASGDERLIRVLLTNLLGNAWKFTRKTPAASIGLGAEMREGELSYSVRDNGAGFDQARVDKLFVPFQRLHSMRDFEGNGIGLATVQRVLQRHGGRIAATGVVGHGAMFTFTLPAARSQ